MSEIVANYRLAVNVIDAHGAGKTIRQALREVGMSRMSFERLCANDESLRAMRAEAAQSFMEGNFDLLLNIDNDEEEGRSDPKMATVISSNIKFVLDKMNPEKFGSKMKVEHNITASTEIVKALEAAKLRAGGGVIIDAVAIEIVDTVADEMLSGPADPLELPAPTPSYAVAAPEVDPFELLAAMAEGA